MNISTRYATLLSSAPRSGSVQQDGASDGDKPPCWIRASCAPPDGL